MAQQEPSFRPQAGTHAGHSHGHQHEHEHEQQGHAHSHPHQHRCCEHAPHGQTHSHEGPLCPCEHHTNPKDVPFGPGMYLHPHPSWGELQQQLSALPEFVVACSTQETDLFGDPIFPGWRFEATIRAPEDSLYARGDPVYSIEIALAEHYPRVAPRIRWQTIMFHPQINEQGLLIPGIFSWDARHNHFLDCLRFCHALLAAPMPNMFEGELPTDEELEGQWRTHDPTCTCDVVPCSFADYLAADPESRANLLSLVRRKLVEPDHEAFEKSSLMAAGLNECMRDWTSQSLRPALYAGDWQHDWLAPTFLRAWVTGTKESFGEIVTCEAPGVYSFDFFTPEFCHELTDELLRYEASSLPKRRPNSMNNYGVILNEIGMQDTITSLLVKYIQPFARLFYADASGGLPLDNHHAFMVQYEEKMDRALDMHSDDSELTVNVNICDQFEGAGLLFCGMHGAPDRRRPTLEYAHRLGRAVVHAGLHRHGAEQLTSGRRLNVIIWGRSSLFRERFGDLIGRSQTTESELDPDLRCVSRTHDADYDVWAQQASASGPSV